LFTIIIIIIMVLKIRPFLLTLMYVMLASSSCVEMMLFVCGGDLESQIPWEQTQVQLQLTRPSISVRQSKKAGTTPTLMAQRELVLT
jgi:hypothetical protein